MYRYYTTRKTDNGIPDCPAIPVPKDIHLYGDKGQSFPFIGTVWSYAEYEEPLATDVVYDYGLKPGPIPQYFPINEQTAKTAKDMMSFSDYKYGSATASYRLEVDKASVMAHYHKQKIDPMYHEKVDGLLSYYAQRLAENINQENSIGTRCPSILVAGGSNFPVRKKPDPDTIRELKSNGFKWSPRNGCWQRQDTDNARHAMKRLSFLKAHA